MVQVLVHPSHGQNEALSSISEASPADVTPAASVSTARAIMAATGLPLRPESKMIAPEDHALQAKDLHRKRLAFRPPRRSWSATECPPSPVEPSAVIVVAQNPVSSAASPLSSVTLIQDAAPHAPQATQTPQPVIQAPVPTKPVALNQAPFDGLPSRPKPVKPPRRAFSVMDYEPVIHTHQPSSRLTLMDLPPEIHFAIFDHLEPLDAACIGLANKHLYAIHRRLNGSVPLSSRRSSPNDMEWAWRSAGSLIHPSSSQPAASTAAPVTTAGTEGVWSLVDKEDLRRRGQVYCRRCGISRCELHRHLREWMGDGYEYCDIRQKFGPPAPEGAKAFCFRSSPTNRDRCGRHTPPKRKVKV